MRNIRVKEGDRILFIVTLLPSEAVIGERHLVVGQVGKVGGETCAQLKGEGEAFNLQATRLDRVGEHLMAAIPIRLRLAKEGTSGIGVSISRV
jgi:hypothetical protein